MNFALLGDDVRILPLIRAIQSSALHEVSHVWEVGPQSEVGREIGRARSVAAWEELLPKDGPRAVILAGDSDDLLTASRRLLGEGKPLFVLPCLGQAASFVYELTLDQADTGAVLGPIFPLRAHPLMTKLARLICEGELGALLHLQLERRLMPEAGRLLAAEQMDRAFLADADLLRFLGGEYDQVTALRSGDPAVGFSLASVTLSGAGKPQAVWSASAADGHAAWMITVLGVCGSATLSGDPDRQELTLEVRKAGGSNSTFGASHRDEALKLVEAVLANADGNRVVYTESVNASDGRDLLALVEGVLASDEAAPRWADLTRAFDWVDATRRSLRRRRTIDLHFEELSERSQFKSQMTAIGCGVLMFTLVAVVLYLMVAQMFVLNDTIKHLLRIAIFAPLGLFLVAQLLLSLTRTGTGRG
jgi:myo-inositol 2-dehydrogenase/D-chiro-inositol 1-dehydrogenase